MGRAPIIVCANCNAELYRCSAVGRSYAGETAHGSDMEPVDESIPQPVDGEQMLCPKCGEPFVGPSTSGVVLKLSNGSWWPHPPIQA
jgi:predicted RNA-binding Zn-ribbon protein involved in translation (DUF1610 family)